jgi:hypothetical protein
VDVVRTWLVTGACALVLAGCGDTRPADAPEDPIVDETSTPSSPQPSPPAGGPAVRQSVADLAATLDVDPGEVEVVSVKEVTWRDGSRGCAQPGMSYTQALIDGSRIILRAGGRTYEYHSGGSQPPSRCDQPTE